MKNGLKSEEKTDQKYGTKGVVETGQKEGTKGVVQTGQREGIRTGNGQAVDIYVNIKSNFFLHKKGPNKGLKTE